MKTLIVACAVLLLCSCAGGPDAQSHMTFNMNGRSAPAMDINNPHYYMNDDREMYVPPPTLQDQMLNSPKNSR